jgi:hypothetical protein
MRKKITLNLPEGVELEMIDPTITNASRQDSAWFINGEHLATLTYKDRTAKLYCVGEMCIAYKDEHLYDLHDLIEYGIKNDKQLYKIEDKGGEWINNSWFEVLDEEEEYGIYHTVKEAIELGAEELVRSVAEESKEVMANA